MLGPFEEEEEGTGIASDVVKVEGEDPATPGLLPKGVDPGTVTIPQYRVNKTKQHETEADRVTQTLNSPHPSDSQIPDPELNKTPTREEIKEMLAKTPAP